VAVIIYRHGAATAWWISLTKPHRALIRRSWWSPRAFPRTAVASRPAIAS